MNNLDFVCKSLLVCWTHLSELDSLSIVHFSYSALPRLFCKTGEVGLVPIILSSIYYEYSVLPQISRNL